MTRLPIVGLLAASCFLFQCASAPQSDDFRARWSESLLTSNTQANTEAEIKFGREVAARMLVDIDGVENFELQKYVNTLGKYLAQYAARSDLEFYFWVIDSETVNAYAMPGGYVFITSAAYKLMENEAQLEAVKNKTQTQLETLLETLRGRARAGAGGSDRSAAPGRHRRPAGAGRQSLLRCGARVRGDAAHGRPRGFHRYGAGAGPRADGRALRGAEAGRRRPHRVLDPTAQGQGRDAGHGVG